MEIWNFAVSSEDAVLQHPLYKKNKKKGRIVALGYFDGVHKGHQEILRVVAEEAHKYDLIPAVHSFTTPPVSKKNENKTAPFLLTTEDEKQKLFEDNGVEEVFLTPFTESVENLSAEEFLNLYLGGLFAAKGVVTGEDYRFGKNRAGDVSYLQKWGAKNGVSVVSVPALEQNNQMVSSTGIRKLLQWGNVDLANELLGYPVSYANVVEKGFQIGRTIHFPTANMRIVPQKMIPCHGVYASMFSVDDRFYPAISNIGLRPTMNRDEKSVCLETMLFDQNIDLYGEQARVFLLDFIRPEMRFDSVDALSVQMQKDALEARAYHEKQSAAYSAFFPNCVMI